MIDRCKNHQQRWTLMFRARQIWRREQRRQRRLLVAQIHSAAAHAIASGLVVPRPNDDIVAPTVH